MALRADDILKLSIAGAIVIGGLAVANYFMIELPKEHSATVASQAVVMNEQRQVACSKSAAEYFKSTNPDSDHDSYENHYNSKMGKCFILVTQGDYTENFIMISLYDAVEKKEYAEFAGAMTCVKQGNTDACALNGGSIWQDGNRERGHNPPDMRFGFKGAMNGGGRGDENTRVQFLQALHPYLNN